MKLNLFQKFSIAIGGTVNVLAGLFPPWTAKLGTDSSQLEVFAGFFFIFRPPQGLDLAKQLFPGMLDRVPSFLSSTISKFVTYEIDLKILLVEWIAVTLITIVAAELFRAGKGRR